MTWFAKPEITRRYRMAWYPRRSPSRTEKPGSIRVRSSMNLRLHLLTGLDRFEVPRKKGSSLGTCKYLARYREPVESKRLESGEEDEELEEFVRCQHCD